MASLLSKFQKSLLLVPVLFMGSNASHAAYQQAGEEGGKNYTYETNIKAAKSDTLGIDYSDWDMVLRHTVWKMGFSDRKYAPRPDKRIGTLISTDNPNPTRFEDNRVFFHFLKKDDKAYIRGIRKSLEAIPDEVPLDQFSADEQLAYWLNLHNVTVYEEIMNRYPVRKLKHFMRKLSDDKRLMVAGKAMSIRDIEELVIKEWQNPLVIYGFYLGAVGGPNLRKGAFTADRVWSDLEDNAQEFTYSLRGLQFDGDRAKVSTFYKRVESAFPNFEEDLKTHFMRVGHSGEGNLLYNASQLAMRVKASPSLRVSISDWYIADFINGNYRPGHENSTGFVLSSMSSEGVGSRFEGLMMNQGAYGQYPPHARELLQQFMIRNSKSRQRSVVVEDVTEDKKEK